jgi:aspartokinase-like uncharacterized kinase
VKHEKELVVVKVGGSLFDLPDLGPRLQEWLDQLDAERILLVPGGGSTANAVRALQAAQGFDDETAHWMALHAVSVNARFLARLLPEAPIVEQPAECQGRAILDAHAFARADDSHPDHLPHSWDVTTDSLAARAAHVGNARRLILVKSIAIPGGTDWREAGRRGWVDVAFARVAEGLDVSVVNFRQ